MKKYSCIAIMVTVGLLLTSTIAWAAQDKIVLRFYTWYYTGPDGPAIDGYIDDFEKKFPNVKIDPAAITNRDYWSRLTLDIMSNVEGDIVGLDGTAMGAYYYLRPGGAFISLDEYIEGTSLEDDLILMDDMKKDDHYIALPYAWNTVGHFFYRKSHFKEAGVDVDSMSTWEGFKEGAVRLTVDLDGDGSIDRYGTTLPTSADAISRWYLQFWFWTVGGGFFKDEAPPYTAENVIFNCPENLFALEYLVDLKRKTFVPGVRDPFQMMELFYNGSISTVFCATWGINMLKANMPEVYEEDLDFFPTPSVYYQGELRPPVYVSWSIPHAISSNCKYPDLAWEFIKFINGEEVQQKWIATGRSLPVHKKVMESPWFEKNRPTAYRFIDLARKFEWQITPDIPQWNEIDKVVQEAMKSAYLETKSPKEVLDRAQAEIVKIMER